eukprot:NODE_34_length_36538_cov_0.612854.p28 type:complete len:117 gc:universal NODE_34_length_36538_cov_0.612854:21896-22246(+)
MNICNSFFLWCCSSFGFIFRFNNFITFDNRINCFGWSTWFCFLFNFCFLWSSFLFLRKFIRNRINVVLLVFVHSFKLTISDFNSLFSFFNDFFRSCSFSFSTLIYIKFFLFIFRFI